MHNLAQVQVPEIVQEILMETETIGFQMVSEPLVGSLLRTLAISKPSGRFLELGTGTGISTAWILNGMDAKSTLVSIDNDDAFVAVAKKYLEKDSRVNFYVEDGGAFLETLSSSGEQFDLIFADTWAGKYTHFEEVIQVLKPGGFYVIDDMLPQMNWPDGHELKVSELIKTLDTRSDLSITKMNWASGVIIAAKQLC
jgi:predicted O-methyltransferase YrrM